MKDSSKEIKVGDKVRTLIDYMAIESNQIGIIERITQVYSSTANSLFLYSVSILDATLERNVGLYFGNEIVKL